MAHWGSCGGSLGELWWLIGGDVVANWWSCRGSLVEMWWLVVPGSNPASLTVKILREGTVYTVQSRGREGNLPLRQKTNISE